MKINNKKETYKIWLQKFIAMVIFAPLLMFFSFSAYFNQPFLGITREWLIAISCILYISVIIYHHLRNPWFVFFSDEGEKIIFKYYPVRAFGSKKNTIQIPRDKFVKFEIQKTLFGEKIILFQRFRQKTGKYPGISLNALSRKDRERIKDSLSKIG